jgi:ferredoxin
MAYIIAEPCIGTKDTACVDVCPVDCIHPAKGRTYDDGRPTFDEVPQLYIDPTECIDCGACVPVCPVTAIFVLDDLPENGTRTSRSTRITLTAVNFSPTSIRRQVADGRLGRTPGTYEYAARNHS